MHNNFSSKNNPNQVFKVPEGYFAQLEGKVLARIENTTPVPKITPLYKNKLVWMVAAACISLFIGIGFIYKTEKNNQLSDDNIENYLEYNLSYSLNNEIINSLDDQDIEDLEQNIEIKQSQIDHYVLTHIDIEYYLNE